MRKNLNHKETHVVNEVSRVTSKCQQFSVLEWHDIAIYGLQEQHDEDGGNEPNPFVVDERERLGSKAQNEARHYTKCEKECGNLWNNMNPSLEKAQDESHTIDSTDFLHVFCYS